VELQAYADADLALTHALEADPRVMGHLGGPSTRAEIEDAHRRRLVDPWWFKIVPEAGGPAAGTIGIWETRHGDELIHETGWMVLPAFQGRGIATAALALLLERAAAEPRFTTIHAFPGVDNAPSNALCRRFGFTLVGEPEEFTFRGTTLRCNHWARPTPASRPAARPAATPAP
jgi:RimJ/RimL family protein N-acetyltransferase